MATSDRSADKAATGGAPQNAPRRYVHMDGLRTSFTWKIGDYGDDGALSLVEMLDLAHRFDLGTDQVRTLSRQLGYALDQDAQVNFIEIKFLPSGARRANDRKKLHEFGGQIAKVKESYDLDADDESRDVDRDLVPRKITEVFDGRRVHVVRECLYVWEESGRSLTFSTDATGKVEGQIYGPLVDFVRAVVRKVTDKDNDVAGGTLRAEIERFREIRAAEDRERSAPSEPVSKLEEEKKRRMSEAITGAS